MRSISIFLLYISLIEIASSWCLRTIFASSHKIRSVDFSPDGEYIVTGSSTGKVLLWKTDTLQILKSYSFPVEVWEAVFSKNQELIAIGGAQDAVDIINATTFGLIRTINTAHGGLVYDLDFKYDSTMLLTCGQDSKTKTWRVSDGAIQITKSNKHETYTCQFSDDNKFAVAGRHYYQTFDAAGTLVHQFHDGDYGDFYGLRVRPGGQYFIATNGNGKLFQSSWAGVNTFHQDGVGGLFACAYSRDSTYFATGGQDGNIYVYNATARANTLEAILKTNSTSSINSSQFSYDSNYLIAGDENGSIYFYERFCHGCPVGSYPNKTTCKLCSQLLIGCSICTNSSLCLSCMSGYYINSATDLCLSCDIIQGCANCNSSSNCSSCLQGWYLNGLTCSKCSVAIQGCYACNASNLCVQCENYYYVSGGLCALCSSLMPNCLYCNGLNSCFQCVAGYAEVNGTCTPCSTSIPNCLICQNSTICQDCMNGYQVNSTGLCQRCSPECLFCNNTGHCFDCIQQMYLTTTFTCSFCAPPCYTCNSSTYCLSCIAGYYLSATGVCTNCPAACLVCNTTSRCQACDVGYYLNTATHTCNRCTLVSPNCRECNSTTCLVCELQYHINGSSCTECNALISHCAVCSAADVCDQCVIGFYATGLTGSSSCGACQAGCINCKSSTQCYACKPGYYINAQDCSLCANNCLTCTSSAATACTSCIEGFYLSTTTTGSCLACSVISKCAACLNSSYCLGCTVGFVLTSPTSCTSCTFPCTTCNSSASDCLTCSLGYYRILTGTIGSCGQCSYGCSECSTSASICLNCVEGFYLDSAGSQCLKCSASLPGCSACENSTYCLTCANGYHSISGSCQPCSVSIPKCLSCNVLGTLCNLCDYGSILSTTKTSCLACSSIPNCEQCNSPTVCETCTNGFYSNAGACLPCSTGCLNCFNGTTCEVCANGYTLLATKTCQLCQDTMAGCQRCTSSSVCTDCIVGYFLNASLCYSCRSSLQGCQHCSDSSHCVQCSVYYQLQLNSTCTLCSSLYAGCQICQNSTIGCSECQIGYYLDSVIPGSCISCGLVTSDACVKCSSNTTCQQCLSGYYLNSSSLCSPCDSNFSNCIFCNTTSCLECQSGYYLSFGICSNCSLLGCEICDQDNPTKCVGCNSRYYLLIDQCFLCTTSIPHCLQCQNSSACIDCASGYHLTSTNLCDLCSITFPGCEICSPSGCIDCKSNYFLNTTDLQCHICTDFIVGCSFCLSQINCISCQDGYYHVNSTCVSCSSITGCLYCINSTLCTKCQQSYFLSSNDSTCYQCKNSIAGCYACDSSTNCISCQGHFQLLGGKCVEIKAQVVKKYTSIGLKSFYINQDSLKHILFAREFLFSHVEQDWQSVVKLTLISLNYTQIPLTIQKVEWSSTLAQIIFYTDNPIATQLKDSVKGMPFMKQSRRLLNSVGVGFYLKMMMKEKTTHQIMPKLSHFGDLYLDYPYSDPAFYESYIRKLTFNYHIFGLVITIVLLIGFNLKICCFVTRTNDRGSIIPHIFSLKCGALALYPTYAQYVNYCYGFMTADLPWLNEVLGSKMANPHDIKPEPYTLYYSNLSLVSTFFLALLLIVFLWCSFVFIQYAFDESKKKIDHIRSFTYNFFSLGATIAGSLCLQGVILNPIDSVNANSVFYVIGVVMYLAIAVEIAYSWSLRRNSAMVKLKSQEDDIGVGGHFRKLRIFVKATLLSLMHLGPLYFLAAIFVIDTAAVLLQYYLAKEEKVSPKIQAAEHFNVNLAFLLLVIIPDALIGLLTASLLIIISISLVVYRTIFEYKETSSLESLQVEGGNVFYNSQTTENDFLAHQKRNFYTNKSRFAKKLTKQNSSRKIRKQSRSNQSSIIATNRIQNTVTNH